MKRTFFLAAIMAMSLAQTISAPAPELFRCWYQMDGSRDGSDSAKSPDAKHDVVRNTMGYGADWYYVVERGESCPATPPPEMRKVMDEKPASGRWRDGKRIAEKAVDGESEEEK